jgi:hypothetical protein
MGRDHTFLVLSHEMVEAFPWRKYVREGSSPLYLSQTRPPRLSEFRLAMAGRVPTVPKAQPWIPRIAAFPAIRASRPGYPVNPVRNSCPLGLCGLASPMMYSLGPLYRGPTRNPHQRIRPSLTIRFSKRFQIPLYRHDCIPRTPFSGVLVAAPCLS